MTSRVQHFFGADEDEKNLKKTFPSRQLWPKDPPGDTGVPFFSPIRDRLDYFYFQGQEKFFQSRIEKYNGSTVFRVNMPPGPFMAKDSRVICLLDAKSFPVLFDMDKVEKKNVFTGTYMPSTSYTGGYRVCSYLDPSEPNHTKIKNILFNLLGSRKSQFIPVFHTVYSALFDKMESEIATSKSSSFNKLNDFYAFEYLGNAYYGSSPSKTLGDKGPTRATKWLFPQLAPIITLGGLIPKYIEDLLLHTFPIPFFLFSSDYRALYSFINSAAGPGILNDPAKLYGLSREEACHNLVFTTCFNSYGGMKVLFPAIIQRIAEAGPKLHVQLVDEIHSAVKAEGGNVTFAALEKMELMKSAVYEALRIDPPVQYQYGKAKKDLVIQSHDAAFNVKKGEMLFGFQPFATRDEKVFYNANQYVPDRFVGSKGKQLLQYVVWSNGPETESTSVNNKQCAGKDFVVLVARLLVVELFLRYDTFTAEIGKSALGIGPEIKITSITKATS